MKRNGHFFWLVSIVFLVKIGYTDTVRLNCVYVCPKQGRHPAIWSYLYCVKPRDLCGWTLMCGSFTNFCHKANAWQVKFKKNIYGLCMRWRLRNLWDSEGKYLYMNFGTLNFNLEINKKYFFNLLIGLTIIIIMFYCEPYKNRFKFITFLCSWNLIYNYEYGNNDK